MMLKSSNILRNEIVKRGSDYRNFHDKKNASHFLLHKVLGPCLARTYTRLDADVAIQVSKRHLINKE